MYFDYAATTPPRDEVLDTFDKVNRKFWANPHALHHPGLRAESLLEQARAQVLSLLEVGKGGRCIFTSGATESNNMAIKGMARLYKSRGKHLISSPIEHPSVLEVFKTLEEEGFELTLLPVSKNGTVVPEVLQKALRPDTTVVSLMHVNNEIGSMNDLYALGKVIKEHSTALYHVDAAQSVGKLPIRLSELQIDILSFSAHKFFGLKGSGAIILPESMRLPPLFHGGGQGFGLRSGTADPARAASLSKALRLALENMEDLLKQAYLYKSQIVKMLLSVQGVEINGSATEGSPFIINCSVTDVRAETILQGLSAKKMYISTVSACSTQQRKASTVVQAITGREDRGLSSIRISLSSLTTQQEVDALCDTFPKLIEDFRFKR